MLKHIPYSITVVVGSLLVMAAVAAMLVGFLYLIAVTSPSSESAPKDNQETVNNPGTVPSIFI